MAQQKGISGVRGLLIDFIELTQPQFNAIVDIAGKRKLFSLVVDTYKTAEDILKLNKEIKGGVIDIYPLESIEVFRGAKTTYPSGSDVKPLIEYVKLTENADARLLGLVENIFSKIVMVKDYSIASMVAKDHNLTAVTPDLQVVYAGAFITKVGKDQSSSESRMLIYSRINKLQEGYSAKADEAEKLQQHQQEVSQTDLDSLRQLQKCEVQLNHLRHSQSELNASIFEVRAQLKIREQKLEQVKISVERVQDMNNAFAQQIERVSEEKTSNKGDFSQDN